jgi:hypothetical protein
MLRSESFPSDPFLGALVQVNPTRQWSLIMSYSDCRMPLDISDEALIADGPSLDSPQDGIDSMGWNINGLFQRSSWLRVRFIISTFRDEILEISLQGMTPSTVSLLE